MSFPNNITKEHLLKAIIKIDEEGIPQNAESNTYDVIFDGRRYPPKVIVSYANYFANNVILDRHSFEGGMNTPCFKLLQENGFEIKTKRALMQELDVKNNSVMVYEVKSSAVANSRILKNKESKYFYWNSKTFSKLNINDYVFIVNKSVQEVLMTRLDKKDISISENKNGKTIFFDTDQQYEVDGSYNEFVRLKIINEIKTDDNWTWKTLGSSETTYLSGPFLNREKTNNRIINLNQLLELSGSEEYKTILNSCLSELKSINILNGIKTDVYTSANFNLSLINEFIKDTNKQNLYFNHYLLKRYIASLATKPFVIFTGLSGSGKTKLAQTFAKWISETEKQYLIIPVGADWTNREPILGYPNSLDTKRYVLPDNGALNLILDAMNDSKDKSIEACKPFFLILDEMNLSHVERYFADFLSGMESKEAIALYSGNDRVDENGRLIPKQIYLPPNLFIVGTVNIDETTYMFSPKVLDRANTIEFRLDESDLINFFKSDMIQSYEKIDGNGYIYSEEFMDLVSKKREETESYSDELIGFFRELQKLGAEYGYRSANEMLTLIQKLELIGLEAKNEYPLDVAVMQKLLPKLNGSRSKLSKVLPVLATFCLKKDIPNKLDVVAKLFEEFRQKRNISTENEKQIKLKLSFEKIARMYTNAIENGFASFAEG
jgi:5-methylcytosine-specific restriction protein B